MEDPWHSADPEPGDSPDRGTNRPTWFLVATGAILVPLLFLFWIFSYAMVPGRGDDAVAPGLALIDIPPGSDLQHIGSILTENGVIEKDIRFALLARLGGMARRLKAGEYRLPYGQSPWLVLKTLAEGRVAYHRVTIPEGSDLQQVADILSAGGWVERDRFLALSRDAELLKEFNLPVESMEGYLFPDTYSFSRGQQNERDILRQMIGRTFSVLASAGAASDSDTGLSAHEILTLASIVEKETARSEERPLIARVFLNRLEKGMRLQADPTAVYGRSDYHYPVSSRDLRIPSPYNTYLIDGLPPGPICNPGLAAIDAVLHPAESDYLYFVSVDGVTHHFSRTLAEHNRAIARLRAGKTISGKRL